MLACAALAASCLWGCGGGGKISSAINGAAIEQQIGGGNNTPAPRKIVYDLYAGPDNVELHSMNIDGTGDIKLSGGITVNYFTADESSDTAFFSYSTYTYMSSEIVLKSDLYSASTNTSGPARLPCAATGTLNFIKWASGVSKLYYTRNNEDPEWPLTSIYRANADCSQEEVVIASPTKGTGHFDVTADGEKVFYTDPGGDNIYVYDIAKATETIFVSAEKINRNLSSTAFLSPDGAKIAYFDDCSNPACGSLYVYNVNGTKIMSSRGEYYADPRFFVWAPDNERIAYIDGNSLYVMSIYDMYSGKEIYRGSLKKLYLPMDWSDDGALLLCMQWEFDDNVFLLAGNVATIKPNGSDIKKITSFTGGVYSSPSLARFSR